MQPRKIYVVLLGPSSHERFVLIKNRKRTYKSICCSLKVHLCVVQSFQMSMLYLHNLLHL